MKKMHIVILVGSYYPNFSAVGICARNIVDELKKEVDISVISQKTTINEKDEEEYDGYTLYRIHTALDSLLLRKTEGRRNSYREVYNAMIQILIRILRYLQAYLYCRNIKSDLVTSYIKGLAKLDKKKRIDAVICCSLPFESVVAGFVYKNKYRKDIISIAYLFDLYASNCSLHRSILNKMIKFRLHTNYECHIFSNYNSILAMHSWDVHLSKYHNQLSDRVYITEHPLCKFKDNQAKANMLTLSHIHKKIVYTGVLLKKIRDPQIALEYFERLLQTNIKIEIHFYILGDCNDKINKLCHKYPKLVFNHGSVPSAVAHQAMEDADILLSIGNKGTGQIPSKLFEYISTGKPIIHFSKIASDPSLKILNKYPNSLIINENKDIITENLNKFICEASVVSDLTVIKEKFKDAMPEYTADLILRILHL